MGKAALGEESILDAPEAKGRARAVESIVMKPRDGKAQSFGTYGYRLRPGVHIRLDLPADMTEAEKEDLADFIKSI
jgi:hypothetical protein